MGRNNNHVNLQGCFVTPVEVMSFSPGAFKLCTFFLKKSLFYVDFLNLFR